VHDEREAIAGLWSIPGVGPKTVASVQQRVPALAAVA
jgi:3-methyladenine DNA glycosylase/8-oxoguanine DNA glycosylase